MRTVRRTQHRRWLLLTALGLILLSAATYTVHYLIFRDAHHIFIYMVGDVAFVFLEVLMVTLVIHRVLEVREVRQRLKKLNVVVGVFFSEVGTDLIRLLTAWDEHQAEDRRRLMVRESWTGAEFEAAESWLLTHEHRTRLDGNRCQQLRCLLVHRRDALLQLLQNPNLLEHESFTELLRMVFHLAEELDLRENLGALPEEDYRHLGEDVRRAHTELVLHWLEYMRHLKREYPYLFSLAMRTNPFDADASPVVGGAASSAAGPACARRPAPT
jgi:hypothetical protein